MSQRSQFVYILHCIWQFLFLPFAVQWHFAIVRGTWLVPRFVLRFTSKPPYPFKTHLPTRGGKHKIPVYVFIPADVKENSKKGDPRALPMHLDFHGGGFFMGSCLEQAPFCAMIARETHSIAITVDYRMGPLAQFPAALEDAEDVLAAILDSQSQTPAGKHLRKFISRKALGRFHRQTDLLDATRITLSGFSSGGNIALNLITSVSTPEVKWPSLLPKDRSHPIPTLLFFPNFDQTLPPHERPMLDTEQTANPKSFMSGLSRVLGPTYLPGNTNLHPRASPGLQNMSEGLHPRAELFLVLPELDSLAVQSNDWLEKMRREGRDSCLVVERAKGMRHGWTQFPDKFLTEEEKRVKYQIFDRTLEFLRDVQGKGGISAGSSQGGGYEMDGLRAG